MKKDRRFRVVILKIIIPIGYSLFIGGSYGMVFKKKFGQSLIQAYCIQILLLLMCGMVFHNLYSGILAGEILSLLGFLYGWRRDKKLFC